MKPKSIGIIGGASPLAGAFLLKRILSLSGEVYGCYRDTDFPQSFSQEQPRMPFMILRNVIRNLNGWD
jgi:hypothetical protein